MNKFKRSFLADNPKNDIAEIRTRKPIRWLTTQEKQRLERAPLLTFRLGRFFQVAKIDCDLVSIFVSLISFRLV